MLFAIGGADLLNRVQGFGERALEQFEGLVFALFQVLDPFTEHDGEIHHQRIEKQDQQGQLPVHPQQHGGCADQRQHGDHELRHGHADEIVDGIQIGDEMRGHRTAAQRFVFTHGNTLQAQQQVTADAINHVLGNQAELAGLPHAQHDSSKSQDNCE